MPALIQKYAINQLYHDACADTKVCHRIKHFAIAPALVQEYAINQLSHNINAKVRHESTFHNVCVGVKVCHESTFPQCLCWCKSVPRINFPIMHVLTQKKIVPWNKMRPNCAALIQRCAIKQQKENAPILRCRHKHHIMCVNVSVNQLGKAKWVLKATENFIGLKLECWHGWRHYRLRVTLKGWLCVSILRWLKVEQENGKWSFRIFWYFLKAYCIFSTLGGVHNKVGDFITVYFCGRKIFVGL